MTIKRFGLLIFSIAILNGNATTAQTTSNYDFERIEDNSFLLEEAYNQEPGVIQHISAFQYLKDKTWSYSFTEEWPAPGQKHQLSATILVLNTVTAGFGDVALNYRYQAIFTERLAFSPRFSLLFPTGDYKNGNGNGVIGYQVNLPVSFILSRKLVTHYNLGTSYIPRAKSTDNTRSDITNINYGASAILLITETFNFMLEFAANTTFINETSESFLFINPGFRYAINCKSGLQIVPGLAVPIGFGAMSGEVGVFAYLSLEHRLWKPKNVE